jgi:ribosomal protein S18 acetylase RimI-like enzyme
MEIRFATIDDLPQILGLYAQLNPEDSPIDLATAEKIWKDGEARNAVKYIVATENGAVVGTCNIAIIPNLTRSGRPYGVIENVITDAGCRRAGIGRAIMEKAVEFAKSNDCYKVLLQSSVKREEAHRFYESIGFSGTTKKGFERRL